MLVEKVRLEFPNSHAELLNIIKIKADRINNQVDERQKKKLRRDEMDVNRARRTIKKMKSKLDTELSETEFTAAESAEIENTMNSDVNENEERTPVNYTTEDLTRDVDIPSREPILLTDNPKFQDASFKTLLSKGPSFVPTPSSANWDQLYQDYERFANSVRREIFFHNSEQPSEVPTTDVPRRSSNWKAPRSNIPEAEVFLKQV